MGDTAIKTPSQSELNIRPIGAFAGEVRGLDLSAALDDSTIAQLRKAWLDHSILVIREQKLTDEQLVAFSRRWGKLDLVTLFDYDRTGILPEVDVITNRRVEGKEVGAAGSRELVWHSDGVAYKLPSTATINYGAEIPSGCVATRFANTRISYEALPQALKDKFQDLQCEWTPIYSGQMKLPDPVVRPIVLTHPETGRKAIYLGNETAGRVVGVSEEESRHLLKQLWDHTTKPEFVWEQQWQQGDVIIWDNRCLIHARGSITSDAPRTLRRVTVHD
ncbi:TauD/TfdA family dioxygenase [Bradyrhizobium sp. Arg62]|uniref:TauD/TfdA dioxygenase family protein n=1 Tax=Bradyrhizobium brasilense TaxID=1419277 RepID=UPI0030B907E0|nr:TauD/TfdA family dioxygenase [Bradyrhizobium brasilense]